MLNYMKFGCLCENKDLCVILQKYESFYAKYLKYKSNFQSLLRASVRMHVIMTLHENLQLSPKLYEIYLNKDKTL
jgi:hypothetical protein